MRSSLHIDQVLQPNQTLMWIREDLKRVILEPLDTSAALGPERTSRWPSTPGLWQGYAPTTRLQRLRTVSLQALPGRGLEVAVHSVMHAVHMRQEPALATWLHGQSQVAA